MIRDNHNQILSCAGKGNPVAVLASIAAMPLRPCVEPAGDRSNEDRLVVRLDALLLSTDAGWAYVCACWSRSWQYRQAGVQASWRLAVRDIADALGVHLSDRDAKELKAAPPRPLERPALKVAPPRRGGVGKDQVKETLIAVTSRSGSGGERSSKNWREIFLAQSHKIKS